MKKYFSILLLFISVTAVAQTNLFNISLRDLNNQPVLLNKYKDKPVYIKAWASWCPLCLAGLADLDKLSKAQDKNFEVITVVSPNNLGEKNTEKFIQWYNGLDYKNIIVLLDEQGEIIKRAKIRGYPSSIILDSKGNVIHTQPGHFTNEQIRAFFK